MHADHSPGAGPARRTRSSRWRFWIDRGGTFTDVVAVDPDGVTRVHKLLSDSPLYDDAAAQGIRHLMGLAADEPIPSAGLDSVRMGTTVATNALLERKGEPVLLLVPQGFRDALRIGYQNRPDIFSLDVRLPQMIYHRVEEVPGRLDVDGRELNPLDLERAAAVLRQAYDTGLRAVAIVFMHAYRYPQQEQQVAELARGIGFEQISCSHEVSPLIRFVSRGDTTVVDAYLSPVLRRYIDRFSAAFSDPEITRTFFMQSGGDLVASARFRGANAILSGPAGGVVGVARTCQQEGFDRIIGFDMGGTSTDVCHFAGEYERRIEMEIAGVRLTTPSMDIHTVAAGGGSVLHFDGLHYSVGPDSAGASPGPACYRNGGPLTVTDCNVLLGKIQPDLFPRLFGESGEAALDKSATRQAFQALSREGAAGDTTPEQMAAGFIQVAVSNMALAIKKISVGRGYDVSAYTLACYGGAAGQHACLVADELGMGRVYLHPLAGVLSALGMGLAAVGAIRRKTLLRRLTSANGAAIRDQLAQLQQQCRQELVQSPGGDVGDFRIRRRVGLAYADAETVISVDEDQPKAMREQFERRHRQRFGFSRPGVDVHIRLLEVSVEARAPAPELSLAGAGDGQPESRRRVYMGGQWRQAPVYARTGLKPDQRIDGPALIVDETDTVVVEPGWRARLTALGGLVLRRKQDDRHVPARQTRSQPDPVMLELFSQQFMSIAGQMGEVLKNTALSVNIRERLDFSCAVFDAAGQLVANAPHVPVHLGSMGDSVQAVISRYRDSLRPGQAYILNSPYQGGTHLPDITVVTPVFVAGQCAFHVASRGHHADIGGLAPGSMPPFSRHIAEEGVLIEPQLLVAEGVFDESRLRALLQSGPYPARNPEQNIADCQAQLAANRKGAAELRHLAEQYGLAVVQRYMGHVHDFAEQSVRRVIGKLSDGRARLKLDNGAVISVAVGVDSEAGKAVIDFTGTSRQQNNNFNAPLPVCRAVVLYVFRTLVGRDIPLNAGCLKPLQLIVPEGCLLNPRYPAAVAAGNVETSQQIADALYLALGQLAASQGTMNNFVFGDDEHQYYETLAGGMGASRHADGASAIQVHMTNSRLTDPEVLESRYPVLVEAFSIRRGSGGAGAHAGGDGVMRRLRFRQALRGMILSGRRNTAPPGSAGGAPGLPGRNRLLRADGTSIELQACAEFELACGDRVEILTPGGAGFGRLE